MVRIAAASLFTWMSIAAAAMAQTGPMAPGADILPEEWRKSAETPLVLTPVVAPSLCLDMSEQDKQAKTVQLLACKARWNQKVWVEPLAVGGGDKVRIRIGQLACLLDGGRQGARATMGICNDTPAAEPWTSRGGQLIGASGLCLDAQGAAADGAPVVAAACGADAKGQQWRLEAMRAALSRGPADRFDPSGFGDYFYSGYVPDIVEQFRPRFTARKLTSAERAEIKSLTAPWRKFKALDGLLGALGGGNRLPPVAIPWSTLRRLSEIGESGDKEAMRAAMEAFALVRDTNYSDTFAGWDETAFPHANNSRLAHGVASKLANLWSAHYWQKHGPDRVAAYALAYCHIPRSLDCAGYTARVDNPKRYSNILKWAQTGDSKFEVAVSGITFHPAGGSYEQRQARFVSVLNGSAFTSVSDQQSFSIDERAINAVFAAQTGRLALWDNVMLNNSFDYPMFTSHQEAYMRTTLKARTDAADWRAKFEAFMAAPDDARAWSIQQGLLTASDADMLRFAERHVVTDEELSDRLCGSGRQATPACQKSRQAIAVRRAEFDRYMAQAKVKREAEQAAQFAAQQAQQAQAARNEEEEGRRFAAMNPPRQPDFWDQLAGLAEGFAAAAEAGDQQVTVRKYDSQGNFVGTETMTRSRAMGAGAQAPN